MKNRVLITVLVLALGAFLYLWYGSKPATESENLFPKATYVNASQDLIEISLPFPGAVVGKKFSVIGKARGSWYFEASFPVVVIGKDGVILDQRPAKAAGEWMTDSFVPFRADIEIPETYIGPATLILNNDNPSGDASRERSVSFDINIEY